MYSTDLCFNKALDFSLSKCLPFLLSRTGARGISNFTSKIRSKSVYKIPITSSIPPPTKVRVLCIMYKSFHIIIGERVLSVSPNAQLSWCIKSANKW